MTAHFQIKFSYAFHIITCGQERRWGLSDFYLQVKHWTDL